MQEFILIFQSIALVLNIIGLIWVAAVKLTRLEVKVEPMWEWFKHSRFNTRDHD